MKLKEKMIYGQEAKMVSIYAKLFFVYNVAQLNSIYFIVTDLCIWW